MLADGGELPQFLIKPDRRRVSERRASGLGGRRSTDELSDLVVLESGRADGWVSRGTLASHIVRESTSPETDGIEQPQAVTGH
jgi:hypothetical protein